MLSLPFSPIASGSSECWNPTLRTNTSPRDDDYVLCVRKTLPKICHIGTWTSHGEADLALWGG